MPREFDIRERLTATLRSELGCEPVFLNRSQWEEMPHERFRFGWSPPVRHETGYICLLSPELIDDTTKTLTKADLDRYLTAIEAYVSGLLAWQDGNIDDTIHRIDEVLYEQAPEALQLLIAVEMRHLDSNPYT